MIVKDLCAVGGVTQPELFVPLAHPPGKALVVIAGVEHKAHDLAMDLPHSDDAGDGLSAGLVPVGLAGTEVLRRRAIPPVLTAMRPFKAHQHRPQACSNAPK